MSDNTVWFVAGADHDARTVRNETWISHGGQTGIIGPESCEVVAQGTPNNTVRIMPGGVSIAATSRTAAIGYPSAPMQSYSKVLNDPVTVEIDPTGSSGGRTDVVGIVIDDPEFEGTSPDPATHQYWRPHVAKNVGNNATRPEHFASIPRPFIPLAQIRIPSSTATITNSMIHDIRFMAITQSETVELVAEANPGSGHLDITPSDTGWVDLVRFDNIQIPQWATRVKVTTQVTHLHPMNGRVGGFFRTTVEGSNRPVSTPNASFVDTSDGQGYVRFQLNSAGDIQVARASQGGTLSVTPQIRRTGDRPGTIRIPDGSNHTSMVVGRVTFEEAPRYDMDGA